MRPSTAGLLLLLAGTIFAAWFFSTHEKVTKEEFVGYRGEARVNDFFAADLLLNEIGYPTESQSSLTPSRWLPESGDTLITRLSTVMTIPEERDLLIGWIADGGHLVLLPPNLGSPSVDEFLHYLDFELLDAVTDEAAEADIESQSDEEEESFAYLVDIDSTRYRIGILDEDAISATLSDDKGVIAARREWAAGYVTIIANVNYFANWSIADHDHARLLLDTVAGYIDPGNIWFIYDSSFPPLWQVIWEAAPYVVASLTAMLVLWLWSIMPVFGPKTRPAPPFRRSIVEHVRAAGRFVWHNRGANALVKSSTAAVLHEAEAKHPGIGRLSIQVQARQIARMTGLPAQAVLDTLTHGDELGHREFTHTMQSLQRIRNKL